MNQVLKIIKDRHHSGSKPGHRTDGYKVGLAVEGGGVRGIVSGGALAGLEALNLKEAFDVVYGSSSGAYSSSFFVSGNTLTGCRFYLDYAQVQFVGLKRYLRGGPLFDLDYVKTNLHGATPLNYPNILTSKPPLHIVATDATRSRSLTFKHYKNTDEIDRALMASATWPRRRKPRPFLFQHHRLLDAYLLDPFCLHSAIRENCTHIVILFSKPWRHRHASQLVDKKVMLPLISRINQHLAEVYLHHGEYSVNGLSHIWNHFDGTHILTVAPKSDRGLPGQLTTNRKKLARGFLAGAEAVLSNFAPDEYTKHLILQSFRQDLHI